MKEKTPTENKNLHNVKEAHSGIETTEQEAWQTILGTRVEVKPLPKIVATEVKMNLERMGFGLRYVPALDLGNISHLRERGVDEYLAELQRKYPKWNPYENLSYKEQIKNSVPRNLERWFWEGVKDGDIDFPVLPGQWLAVETVAKPSYGKKYSRTAFAEKIGFGDDRFNASWNLPNAMINRRK